MTRTFILLVCIFAGATYAQEPKNEKEIQWYSIEEAMELQNTHPRKIFIDVYTDWCGWCTKMDNSTFTEQAIVEILNEKFYPVKFDAESSKPVKFTGRVFTNPNPEGRRSTHKLTYELLGQSVSYPSYAMYDENNRKLTVLKGYMTGENLLPVLEYIGNNAYLDQKWEAYLKDRKKSSE